MTTLSQLSGTYTLDPAHSRLGFVARHAMVTKVRGSFDEFSGEAVTGPGLADARIAVTIQVASVDTRNDDRDAHLRTGDFFDAAQYPTIEFVSTSVAALDEETLRVAGDLTIKGTTQPVTIDFAYAGSATDPYGHERLGFEGSTTVNRKDFGLSYNAALEAGGVLISEKITLEFELSAIKA